MTIIRLAALLVLCLAAGPLAAGLTLAPDAGVPAPSHEAAAVPPPGDVADTDGDLHPKGDPRPDAAQTVPQAAYLTLVVGNSNYDHLGRLVNPSNDAREMARLFEEFGHEVILLLDADRASLMRAVRRVERAAPRAEVVTFYYAGHGASRDGVNYLFPADFDCDNADCIDREAINMNEVVYRLEAAAPVFFGIFDSCRDNPFASGETNRGLALVEGLSGDTMLVYATAPGAVALDGTTGNSPFTGALIDALRNDPTAPAETTLRRVRQDVVAVTDGMQVPWTSSSLTREISLAAPAVTTVPTGDEPSPVASVEALPQALRVQATLAFDALGSAPDRDELVAWLDTYGGLPGLETLVDLALSRLTNLAARDFDVAAVVEADGGKGGTVFRNLPAPQDSPLGMPGRRTALVVGINDYAQLPDHEASDLPLRDLRFAENDARDFDLLLRTGRLGRWEIDRLIGPAANQFAVTSSLKRLLLSATDSDILLVFFSGHGSTDAVEQSDVFLMLQDSFQDHAESGLTIRTLERWMKLSRARQIVFIIDACKSGYSAAGAKGGGRRSHFTNDALLTEQLLDSPNRIFLTSSTGDQTSWEDATLGNGIFTHFLVRALRGESPERVANGFVDLAEAFEFTLQGVREYSRRHPAMSEQEPSLRETSGNSISDFPIAFR